MRWAQPAGKAGRDFDLEHGDITIIKIYFNAKNTNFIYCNVPYVLSTVWRIECKVVGVTNSPSYVERLIVRPAALNGVIL